MKSSVIIRLVATAFLLSSSAAYAEEKSEYSIGMAYVGGDSIYSNVKSTSAVMPSISYKSDTLSISFQEGFAYNFFDVGKTAVSASITPKFRPYKSSDSPNLTGMTRDMYVDGSLKASYEVSRGLTAKLKLETELTNKFNGHSLDISISQFIPIFGQPLILQTGAKWYDTKRTNYLYGVNASEVTAQRAEYTPGSALLPYISASTFYSLTNQTSLFANVNINLLPRNVVDSLIVDRNSVVLTVLGLNYSF
tara:strand:- start:754 stop:1503 length:750 start_codon:yes stop_codon:yes gene_type:complete